MALGETLEPWESAEVGVDVVMHHLEAARSIAHHGGMFRSNAETKLQGELDLDVESTAGFLLEHKFLRRLKKKRRNGSFSFGAPPLAATREFTVMKRLCA